MTAGGTIDLDEIGPPDFLDPRQVLEIEMMRRASNLPRSRTSP